MFATRAWILLVLLAGSTLIFAHASAEPSPQVLEPALPAGVAIFPVQATDFPAFVTSQEVIVEPVFLDGEHVVLELSRFEVFSPDATLVAVLPSGETLLERPAIALFRGVIRGIENSRVFLSVAPSGVYGLIHRDTDEYVISSGAPDAGTPAILFNPRRIPEELLIINPFECTTDLLPRLTNAAPDTGGVAGVVPCRIIDLAVETDQEYLNSLFGGSTSAANAYIATLFGAISEIYERDTNARFLIVYSRLWSSEDPWDQTNTIDQLYQFRDYWNTNMTGINRDLVHFLSGRGLGGGVAYVGATCYPQYDYGLSANLNGYFPYPVQNNNSQNWDLLVVAHELGHNVGAPHTHNMNPPVDCCGGAYGSSGCNNTQDCSAAEAGIGTIMSYCHICPGGLSNVRMEFHIRTINETILPYLSSVESTCGLGPRPATILNQPDSIGAAVGTAAQFSVVAQHGWPLSYQWRRNGVNLSNGGAISGATSPTLTINPVNASHAGSYTVRITTACGPAVISNPATLTICVISRLYVDDDASAGGNGTSWSTAFRKLRDALDYLDTVCGHHVTEIWVAAGTHRPDETNTNPNGNGDRSASFTLRSGVSIIGGFRGQPGDEGVNNHTTRPLDTITGHPILVSSLSGDLSGNDVGAADDPSRNENSYHVVTGSNTDTTAVLDGFTIRGGYANGTGMHQNGGGFLVEGGAPILRNCSIVLNFAAARGGGAYLGNSGTGMPATPFFENCVFVSNHAASDGGGVAYQNGAELTLLHCVFSGNTSGTGGAIWSFNDTEQPLSLLQVRNSVFTGNTADTDGGAVWIYGNALNQFVNCVFWENTSALHGGAVNLSNGILQATTNIINCTFTANDSGNGFGEAIHVGGGVLNLRNSILWAELLSNVVDSCEIRRRTSRLFLR